MAIRTVVTRGYGNGTFDGTIALVVLRGYVPAIPQVHPVYFNSRNLNIEFPNRALDIYFDSRNLNIEFGDRSQDVYYDDRDLDIDFAGRNE